MSYWSLSMVVKERNLKRLNGDPLRSGDPYARWRGHKMWICFWELKINGLRTAPTILQSSMRCSYMPPQKDGKRQNSTSAEASGGKCPSWTQRWIYPPFSWCNPKPAGRNSLIFTWRSTSCTGCPAPHQGNRPFLKRYQLPSFVPQWRKKTLLMLQHSGVDCLNVKETIH